MQGVVILECTISPQGKVTDVKVLRGIPLLDAAAIEAVKQWVYSPDPAQRRARAGDHDRHRELPALLRPGSGHPDNPVQEDATMQFDLRTMVEHMGGVAWGVVIVLAIMSIYSIGVMIERYYTYHQATKQSRKYAPEVARFLKQGKIKEAIDASHGADREALAPGQGPGGRPAGMAVPAGDRRSRRATRKRAVDAAKRAIQRATAVNLADLKRGLSGLATIGSTAPFVGLFGTTFGIINAFSGMALTGSGGIAAISAGIAEALITTAFGLFVAVPAVWAYNYFAGKVEGFNVEMDNSSSELLDYFIKKGA